MIEPIADIQNGEQLGPMQAYGNFLDHGQGVLFLLYRFVDILCVQA